MFSFTLNQLFSHFQPRTSYKEFYIVFRASSKGNKQLDLYLSDKKYAEHVQPKWTVDLSTVSSINVMNDNRVCFYVEHSNGAMCLFEGKLIEEVEDWISCFNAVLFTKGPHGGECPFSIFFSLIAICACECV